MGLWAVGPRRLLLRDIAGGEDGCCCERWRKLRFFVALLLRMTALLRGMTVFPRRKAARIRPGIEADSRRLVPFLQIHAGTNRGEERFFLTEEARRTHFDQMTIVKTGQHTNVTLYAAASSIGHIWSSWNRYISWSLERIPEIIRGMNPRQAGQPSSIMER